MAEPTKFPGCNVTFAANQPEYRPLPALRLPDGMVVTCWKLTWRERFTILLRGKLWISMLTFGLPSTARPEEARRG